MAGMFLGDGRPKTAAMGGGGLPRPPTAYKPPYGLNNPNMASGLPNTLNFHRAVSA